jgi:lysophospholipase L1-like esterase
LELAYEKGPFSYKDAAQKGYPLLIKEGKKLIGDNVNFVDLTMLFINENRTVYNDKCCHFNQLGYDLIADKITNTIISKNN